MAKDPLHDRDDSKSPVYICKGCKWSEISDTRSGGICLQCVEVFRHVGSSMGFQACHIQVSYDIQLGTSRDKLVVAWFPLDVPLSGLSFQKPELVGLQTPDTRFQTSDLQDTTADTRHQTPDTRPTRHQTPDLPCLSAMDPPS